MLCVAFVRKVDGQIHLCWSISVINHSMDETLGLDLAAARDGLNLSNYADKHITFSEGLSVIYTFQKNLVFHFISRGAPVTGKTPLVSSFEIRLFNSQSHLIELIWQCPFDSNGVIELRLSSVSDR
jgi:hypothetical protein